MVADGPVVEADDGVLEGCVIGRAVVSAYGNGRVVYVLPPSSCIHQGIIYKFKVTQGYHLRALWDAIGRWRWPLWSAQPVDAH